MVIKEEDYLEHFGVKGMKWYQHKFGKQDTRAKYVSKADPNDQKNGLKNLKNAKTVNLDKWGKSADTNVCYIAGQSGSGKSTTALTVARKNDKVIHLDMYMEEAGDPKWRDKDFNKYLKNNMPKDKKSIKDFSNAIEGFGREQFKKGNRVVVEGVQLTEGTLHKDNSFYKDKPIIILQTNPVKSMKQAFKRDGRGNLITGLKIWMMQRIM